MENIDVKMTSCKMKRAGNYLKIALSVDVNYHIHPDQILGFAPILVCGSYRNQLPTLQIVGFRRHKALSEVFKRFGKNRIMQEYRLYGSVKGDENGYIHCPYTFEVPYDSQMSNPEIQFLSSSW